MRRVLAFSLCALAGVATADPGNPCGAPASAPKAPYVDLTSSAGGFRCAPSPIGEGTLPTLRSNAAGTVVWWYCPSASGRWQLSWGAATAERLRAGHLMAELYTIVTAPDRKAAFDATVAANATLPVSDPSLTPVWCPFAPEMLTGAPPPIAQAQRSPANRQAMTSKAMVP